jgi:hypothetical protein
MGWYLLAFLFISFAFSSVPQAPVYPDLYTVSFTMNPGSLVLEAYDFTAKQQVFWFSGKNEVKVLNRFDLGQSFTTALNATCTKAPISEMQPPNFLSSFTYSGNQTCTSPKLVSFFCRFFFFWFPYLLPVKLFEEPELLCLEEGSSDRVHRFNERKPNHAASSGCHNLLRADPNCLKVKSKFASAFVMSLPSFNPAVFRVPAVCETEK